MVRDVIRFAKKVPGFTALDLDDQVSLIKGGCFEVSVFRRKIYSLPKAGIPRHSYNVRGFFPLFFVYFKVENDIAVVGILQH